jgi:hypothetical protein
MSEQDRQNGLRAEWRDEVDKDGTPQEVWYEDGQARLAVVRLSDVKMVDAPAAMPPKQYYLPQEDEDEDDESGLRGYLEHAGWNPIVPHAVAQ